MAYTKTSLISRPVESSFGLVEDLGGTLDLIKSGVSSVVDSYKEGIRAQGRAEAYKAQADQAQAAKDKGSGGISTTMLLVGGAALAGVLVFALRKK